MKTFLLLTLSFFSISLFSQETAEVELFLKMDGVIQNDMDQVEFFFISMNDTDDKEDDDTIKLNFIGYKFSTTELPGEGTILFRFHDYEIDITKISFEDLLTVKRIEIEMWTEEKPIKKQMKAMGLPKQKCDKLNLLATYNVETKNKDGDVRYGIIVECYYFD